MTISPRIHPLSSHIPHKSPYLSSCAHRALPRMLLLRRHQLFVLAVAGEALPCIHRTPHSSSAKSTGRSCCPSPSSNGWSSWRVLARPASSLTARRLWQSGRLSTASRPSCRWRSENNGPPGQPPRPSIRPNRSLHREAEGIPMFLPNQAALLAWTSRALLANVLRDPDIDQPERPAVRYGASDHEHIRGLA